MSVDDALASVRHGVDAVWVSNHGARQLDTAPATIEVLHDICRAVAGRVEVYLDGGVTRGTDVLKVRFTMLLLPIYIYTKINVSMLLVYIIH